MCNMRKVKVSKSITLTLDNVMVIDELMTKTKRNFSWTLNYILSNWVELRQKISEARSNEALDNQIKNLQKAKAVKE